METHVSDMRKRALDALEERFKAAKAKQDQVDQSNSNAYPQKDLANPSSPAQLASSQKGKPALASGFKSQQKVSHSFDGENHPIYSEMSEFVHENLLQGITMEEDTNRRDAVEKILIDIMRKGDESGSALNGAKKLKKENWVLLDNYLSKDDNSLANARAKSLKSHSKRSKNHMSMKQHRHFERFKPMHAMWKEYICELVKDTGKKQLNERLLTADLHGAFLSVVESKILSFGGISGIMVRETTETFGIVTQNNKFKVVPKAGSVFMLQADKWTVTLCGDMLSVKERLKESASQLRLQPLLR
ncbi:Ribonuclease P protein subunit p29 [Carex littledalei]|uniref:Ribonuclease P protein subunit p29 n=1 Tax=Carex littledalei TaxID=544730 RepID=A0A833VWN8_9POAL|nr:Ribonuclease P protein subunit p29 [Carex littledalei]